MLKPWVIGVNLFYKFGQLFKIPREVHTQLVIILVSKCMKKEGHKTHTRISNFTLPQTNPAICGFDDTKVSTTTQYWCTDCRSSPILEVMMRLLRSFAPPSRVLVNWRTSLAVGIPWGREFSSVFWAGISNFWNSSSATATCILLQLTLFDLALSKDNQQKLWMYFPSCPCTYMLNGWNSSKSKGLGNSGGM